MPEHFRFHEWLKAAEFLKLHGNLYGLSGERLADRISELLDLVGLTDSREVKLSSFSKGMLQRIGLAQAMLNEPDLIFLDEPTSGLDPLGRRLVRDIISQLKAAGTTVFLNSHLLGEVEAVCDRVAFIRRGQIVRASSMAELLNQTTEVNLQVDALTPALLEALEHLGRQVQPDGNRLTMLVDDQENVPEIAQAVQQQGAKLYALVPRQKSLEDIFVEIIGQDDGDRG